MGRHIPVLGDTRLPGGHGLWRPGINTILSIAAPAVSRVAAPPTAVSDGPARRFMRWKLVAVR
ncbi:MAG TPA: hypothetical protein VM076_19220 [Gemmatimonadaceae bacterium]|nr:hypothetical protein [Gemmatimonadaceae bacterium]